MYNALQPGVFALSGWDLVGALPLARSAVEPLLADGDTRWINRGAYDLMGTSPGATVSGAGLPIAPTLYGSLPKQLSDPNSFASQLRHMLEVRQIYRIYAGRQVYVPPVQNKGLLILVHELPDALGTQVTALNFASSPIDEKVPLPDVQPGEIVEMLSERVEGRLDNRGYLSVRLDGYEGKSYLVSNSS
jgi:trehalose synthase